MPINFTLQYKDRVTDTTDTAGDRAMTPGIGKLLAEPVLSQGVRLPFGADMGYLPRAVEMYLDSDGELKPEPGGSVGVRLDANDPAFGLSRLQYRVSAPEGLTDVNGVVVPWLPVHFDAPVDDRIVYLAKELPRPGQKFGRGRNGFTIESWGINEDGLLAATREDGTELDPVPILVSPALSVAYALTFGRL